MRENGISFWYKLSSLNYQKIDNRSTTITIRSVPLHFSRNGPEDMLQDSPESRKSPE